MSNQSFLPKLAATALLALGAAAVFSPSSQAQRNQYYCGTIDGVPTTMYSSYGKETPLVRWQYDGFGNWNPPPHCEEVSRRFQQYQDEGTLEFITTGRMKGHDVVCVARSQGGGCEGRLLFTIPPGRDPNQALEAILDISGVRESNDPRSEVNGRLYIDIDQLIYQRKNSR